MVNGGGYFFDCDECMSYENYELLGDFISARGVRQDFPEWSTELMHHLFKNENFKQSFRYRFNELLESTFSTQNLMKTHRRNKGFICSRSERALYEVVSTQRH